MKVIVEGTDKKIKSMKGLLRSFGVTITDFNDGEAIDPTPTPPVEDGEGTGEDPGKEAGVDVVGAPAAVDTDTVETVEKVDNKKKTGKK